MSKILLVDDDPGVIALLEPLLKGKGYEVISSYDGVDALEKVKSEDPDLLILDIMMPGVDGYEVCNKIRFGEEYRQIPIILLTAKERELDERLGEKLNIDYIHKPADTEVLLQKVATLLEEDFPKTEYEAIE